MYSLLYWRMLEKLIVLTVSVEIKQEMFQKLHIQIFQKQEKYRIYE